MKTGLSVSGGGFKAIYSLSVLKDIYKTYSFDIMVGNSTGSIVTSALSLGLEPSKILDIYLTEGKKIFQPSMGYKIKSGNGLFLPKYEAKTLENLLKKIFGDKVLSQLEVPFMCNAYNLTTDEPIIFKSWKPEFRNIKIWEAVKASCSAPTYFSPHIIDEEKYIDGGISDTNLSLSMYIEMKKLYPNEEIKIIDIGTGHFKREYKSGNGGLKDWGLQVLDLMMDANDTTTPYILRKVKSESDIYMRFDKELSYDIKLDDVSDKAIKELLK